MHSRTSWTHRSWPHSTSRHTVTARCVQASRASKTQRSLPSWIRLSASFVACMGGTFLSSHTRGISATDCSISHICQRTSRSSCFSACVWSAGTTQWTSWHKWWMTLIYQRIWWRSIERQKLGTMVVLALRGCKWRYSQMVIGRTRSLLRASFLRSWLWCPQGSNSSTNRSTPTETWLGLSSMEPRRSSH